MKVKIVSMILIIYMSLDSRAQKIIVFKLKPPNCKKVIAALYALQLWHKILILSSDVESFFIGLQ